MPHTAAYTHSTSLSRGLPFTLYPHALPPLTRTVPWPDPPVLAHRDGKYGTVDAHDDETVVTESPSSDAPHSYASSMWLHGRRRFMMYPLSPTQNSTL